MVRWKCFFDYVESLLAKNQFRDEKNLPRLIGRPTLESDAFYRSLYRDFERKYPHQHELPPPRKAENVYRLSRKLYAKYRHTVSTEVFNATGVSEAAAKEKLPHAPEVLAGFAGSGPVIPLRNG